MPLPSADYTFEIKVVTTTRAAGRPLHQLLVAYREERHGPTMLVVQVYIL